MTFGGFIGIIILENYIIVRCSILTTGAEKRYPESCSDEALLLRFRRGDDSAFEALVSRYMGLISSAAESFRTCALSSDDIDIEDFVQVGLMGLLSACKTFDEKKGKSFKNFALDCAKNRFRDMAKASSKKSAVPPDNIVSLDGFTSLCDENEGTLAEALERKEYIRSRYREIKEKLSPFEYRVSRLYLSGYSYKECAERLKVDEKKVDNALTRIRKKLSR